MKIRLEDGTELKLRYLVKDTDRHGNVRVYVRHRGRKVRIRELATVEEFMAAYRAALETESQDAIPKSAAVAPGSLRWLVRKYFGSAEYRLLGKITRRVRKAMLEDLCEKDGDKPFALLEPRHVRSLRDKKAEFPEAANARVKALRQVFKWAVEAGHAARNPAREVPYLRPKNPDGWHAWTIEEVAQFEARHPIGSKARLALALLLYTGVRRSDAVRLGRQMERDGNLYFRETKGQARRIKDRELPILPELRLVLDATPSGHLAYITTAFGKPFTPAGFGNWFRRRCNEAGATALLGARPAQGRRDHRRRQRRDRASTHGDFRLGQPETGRARYPQGKPKEAGSRGHAHARPARNCPTFEGGCVRWDR